MIFNNLTVIERDLNKTNGVYWTCKCVCGNYTSVESHRLKNGRIKSCGCKQQMLKNDLTGQRFGKLTVISRAPNHGKRVMWNCKCDCGEEKTVYGSNLQKGLTQSCGCLHKEMMKSKMTKDISGQRFGRLVAICRDISMDKPGEKPRYWWSCRCDCGNTVSVVRSSLVNGATQSCGCLRSEITSQRFTNDLTGQRFGRILVLYRKGTAIGADGAKYATWWCECDCGTEKEIKGADLVAGKVSSCGCLISHGEEAIRKILNTYGITYKTQYKFDDLYSSKGWPLRFDFAIINEDDAPLCLIEYQGQQHFDESYGYFGQQQREVTDGLKKEYCKKHNIRLYEIRYNDNISEAVKNILQDMHVNPVLSDHSL